MHEGKEKFSNYVNKCSPAYLKKNEDRIPCAALFNIKSIVAFECPSKILKLSGPEISKR